MGAQRDRMEGLNVAELRERIISFDVAATLEGPDKLFANVRLIPAELLIKADWNYKEHDEVLQQKLGANIRRNGQLQNIIVRDIETGFFEVVNGNHRVDEVSAAGYRFVLVYDLGCISLAHAQRIAVETNETRFKTDGVRLAELMKEVSATFDLADLAATMPYNEQQLTDMSRLLDFDWNDFQAQERREASREKEEQKGKTIELTVPEETYNVWQKWQERCREIIGYDTPERAFELAIVEALNIPEESLR